MSTDSKTSESGSTPQASDTTGAQEENKTEQEQGVTPEHQQRDIQLTENDAEAGSPEDEAVIGEEDPGSGLEFLITDDDE